jgi:tensin
MFFCFFFQGCPKQFRTITSLLVHHSVMPEMLPCPLSLNRYNPTFRPTEDGDGDDDLGGMGGGDYLDLDRDYEVIAQLRQGLLLGNG